MIRYRLAQSNTWVYSIQKTEEDENNPRRNVELLRQCKLELQAWIMKMDPTREYVPAVVGSEHYDYRCRTWRIDASWLSPRRLHGLKEENMTWPQR